MEIFKHGFKYSLNQQFFKYVQCIRDNLRIKPETVVVDFSSPNIAKPFHSGHLRATLVGNFVCNINELFGHQVHRVNYLGDWGTQFGLLLHGLEKFGGTDNASVRHFYEVYVKANSLFSNQMHLEDVKETQMRLQNGDPALQRQWDTIRTVSVAHLRCIYDRLGIRFDEFDYESSHHTAALNLMVELCQETTFVKKEDGAIFYCPSGSRRIALVTNKGASLYISREISASIARSKKFSPFRMHYVVELSQQDHFRTLDMFMADLAAPLNPSTSDQETITPRKVLVPFGKIAGINTRMGNLVFLDEILDRAAQLMLERLNDPKKFVHSPTSELPQIAEKLGKTIIFCDLLRHLRMRQIVSEDWNFRDTGFRIQYTRAVLTTLEKQCLKRNMVPHITSNIFQFDHLIDKFGFDSSERLIKHLQRFESVLVKSYNEYESSYLVEYVAKLASLANVALREIKVMQDNPDAEERLRLFVVTNFVLEKAMHLLGLPLVDRI